MVLVIENLPASSGDVRDAGLILGSGRSPRVRNGNRLQYSCLENPMDRGAWRATVHKVTKSQTRLKQFSLFCVCKVNEILEEGNNGPVAANTHPTGLWLPCWLTETWVGYQQRPPR